MPSRGCRPLRLDLVRAADRAQVSAASGASGTAAWLASATRADTASASRDVKLADGPGRLAAGHARGARAGQPLHRARPGDRDRDGPAARVADRPRARDHRVGAGRAGQAGRPRDAAQDGAARARGGRAQPGRGRRPRGRGGAVRGGPRPGPHPALVARQPRRHPERSLHRPDPGRAPAGQGDPAAGLTAPLRPAGGPRSPRRSRLTRPDPDDLRHPRQGVGGVPHRPRPVGAPVRVGVRRAARAPAHRTALGQGQRHRPGDPGR